MYSIEKHLNREKTIFLNYRTFWPYYVHTNDIHLGRRRRHQAPGSLLKTDQSQSINFVNSQNHLRNIVIVVDKLI